MAFQEPFYELVQERCNSIANSLELHLSYTDRLIYDCWNLSMLSMQQLDLGD